jgi:hypothetical protein
MTSDFEEDIVRPTEEKKTPNNVQAVWISPRVTPISLWATYTTKSSAYWRKSQPAGTNLSAQDPMTFRHLVSTFQKNEHPLRDSGLDIQPEVGYTRHELVAILSTPRVNRHMEVALSGVYANMYSIVAPLELRAGIALFSPTNLFYTDGSLMVHWWMEWLV